MKYILSILIVFFIIFSNVRTAEPEIYIRPAVKLGYQFGDNGGFVYGFELGLINYKNGINTQTYLFGLISSIEFCNGNRKLHFGLELSDGKVAIEIGPSIYNFEDENYFGLTFGIYSLFIITPYIEYTKIFNDEIPSLFQTAAFLKVPIPFGNRSIKFH